MNNCKNNDLKVNVAKSKMLLLSRNSMQFSETPVLPLVEELKILGITIRSDLSWSTNTRIMCGKAYSRLWILRRLKPLGVQLVRVSYLGKRLLDLRQIDLSP